MQVKTTRGFDKQYARLAPADKSRFKARIGLFLNNPYEQKLRNHGLKGKYLGYRSINIRGDLRAIYKLEANQMVIFAFIGSHSQLY